MGEFGRLDGAARPDSLVAMGGAVTNLSAVMQSLAAYDNDAVDGSVLDRSEAGEGELVALQLPGVRGVGLRRLEQHEPIAYAGE